MDRDFIINRAIPFFTAKKYHLQTRTDDILVFQSEEREVNWIIFLVLCCLGILWAVIYYFVFCQKNQVTLSLSGGDNLQVTTSGNSDKARKDGEEFVKLLSAPPDEGTLCSQCGSPIQPGKNFCSNCGQKIA
jgi:hypothetical protein